MGLKPNLLSPSGLNHGNHEPKHCGPPTSEEACHPTRRTRPQSMTGRCSYFGPCWVATIASINGIFFAFSASRPPPSAGGSAAPRPERRARQGFLEAQSMAEATGHVLRRTGRVTWCVQCRRRTSLSKCPAWAPLPSRRGRGGACPARPGLALPVCERVCLRACPRPGDGWGLKSNLIPD